MLIFCFLLFPACIKQMTFVAFLKDTTNVWTGAMHMCVGMWYRNNCTTTLCHFQCIQVFRCRPNNLQFNMCSLPSIVLNALNLYVFYDCSCSFVSRSRLRMRTLPGYRGAVWLETAWKLLKLNMLLICVQVENCTFNRFSSAHIAAYEQFYAILLVGLRDAYRLHLVIIYTRLYSWNISYACIRCVLLDAQLYRYLVFGVEYETWIEYWHLVIGYFAVTRCSLCIYI